ncbi:spondin domain-containing protein [Paraglaciecola sp. L3A3]|uniref:spondin domain-containing protein n=1 Tax=Paraglaciecola sp. L3A3 TaxID=2686358 RepID=UPI00131AF2B0|nr:spondin domain-containing protein [Paraglaciecola sp. L3A3]
MLKVKKLYLVSLVASALLLTACNDDKIVEVIKEVEVEVPAPVPTPVDVSYEISVTNLTNSQPLSPVAVILHKESHIFAVGDIASLALEQMAEGGDNSGLMNWGFALASASGAAPIGPGASETIKVTIQDMEDANLSIASMLVNTNDGFSGLDAWSLSQLAVGDSWTTNAFTYDAGTEANTEAAGTIPGPADGSDGAGFNTDRDDSGYISMHPGVVSSDDGLSTSILTQDHKFDNPSIRIQVTRIE